MVGAEVWKMRGNKGKGSRRSDWKLLEVKFR